MSEKVIIVGVGQGLSASLARLFHKEGMQVVLAARDVKKLELRYAKHWKNKDECVDTWR